MKASQVEIGGVYAAKVSGNLVHVKITGKREVRTFGGAYKVVWSGTNLKTNRSVEIRSAQRLRYRIREGEPQVRCRLCRRVFDPHWMAPAPRVTVGPTPEDANYEIAKECEACATQIEHIQPPISLEELLSKFTPQEQEILRVLAQQHDAIIRTTGGSYVVVGNTVAVRSVEHAASMHIDIETWAMGLNPSLYMLGWVKRFSTVD